MRIFKSEHRKFGTHPGGMFACELHTKSLIRGAKSAKNQHGARSHIVNTELGATLHRRSSPTYPTYSVTCPLSLKARGFVINVRTLGVDIRLDDGTSKLDKGLTTDEERSRS